MILRPLELKDAPFMLEWMHDSSITTTLNTDFSHKNLQDCEKFISDSNNFKQSIHLAITDNTDTYQGTISLKQINSKLKNAEFAITIRKTAMGTGLAKDAMSAILSWGINTKKLNGIYWCVKTDNIRAIRFYNKNGYTTTSSIPENIKNRYKGQDDLIWYVINNNIN